QDYQPISKETMRAFEIRWLDLRIQGLIEQRENTLSRLKKLASSSTSTSATDIGDGDNQMEWDVNAFDDSTGGSRSPTSRREKHREAFLNYMLEELQIYRTLTLYITEYILTWCERQPNKETYIWK